MVYFIQLKALLSTPKKSIVLNYRILLKSRTPPLNILGILIIKHGVRDKLGAVQHCVRVHRRHEPVIFLHLLLHLYGLKLKHRVLRVHRPRVARYRLARLLKIHYINIRPYLLHQLIKARLHALPRLRTRPVMIDAAAEHGVLLNVSYLARVLLHEGVVRNVSFCPRDHAGIVWILNCARGLICEALVHLVLKQVILIRNNHNRPILRQEVPQLLHLLLYPLNILIRLIRRIVHNDRAVRTAYIRLINRLVPLLARRVPDIYGQLVVLHGSEILLALVVHRPNGHLLLPVEEERVHLGVVGEAGEAQSLCY